MQKANQEQDDAVAEQIEIDLKDPALAAFLAWLIPGAGHLYQGRTAKGILFMTCILGTFVFGMVFGQGQVVYAQWEPHDKRWAYFCQFPAGLAALPAIVPVSEMYKAPGPIELNRRHNSLHRFFDLGTVYTMIAGLLNILAIYDAWGGPVIVDPDRGKKRPRPPNDEDDEDPDAPET
ncbi:MAG: hypothetical protein IIA67_03755 [Planctomycetes bacterium]|nr:hypothetical protein [Planctomycetota bacterium]